MVISLKNISKYLNILIILIKHNLIKNDSLKYL